MLEIFHKPMYTIHTKQLKYVCTSRSVRNGKRANNHLYIKLVYAIKYVSKGSREYKPTVYLKVIVTGSNGRSPSSWEGCRLSIPTGALKCSMPTATKGHEEWGEAGVTRCKGSFLLLLLPRSVV